MPDHQLILASTSPFRKELLDRLNIPFEQIAPDCDETAARDEAALDLVGRLAREKALSVQVNFPGSNAVVIGSDQVADLNGTILGKPHTHEAATDQLQALSSNTVMFYTGLCVVKNQQHLQTVVTTEVRFRALSPQQIERYLQADQPYGCAASFKSECMGSAIVEYMRSDDPTALVGLPLIQLAGFLSETGIAVP